MEYVVQNLSLYLDSEFLTELSLQWEVNQISMSPLLPRMAWYLKVDLRIMAYIDSSLAAYVKLPSGNAKIVFIKIILPSVWD